jgi:hypothetical protein
VPIRPFLQPDHSFGPEDIESLSAAFATALSNLGLVDRADPNFLSSRSQKKIGHGFDYPLAVLLLLVMVLMRRAEY